MTLLYVCGLRWAILVKVSWSVASSKYYESYVLLTFQHSYTLVHQSAAIFQTALHRNVDILFLYPIDAVHRDNARVYDRGVHCPGTKHIVGPLTGSQRQDQVGRSRDRHGQ